MPGTRLLKRNRPPKGHGSKGVGYRLDRLFSLYIAGHASTVVEILSNTKSDSQRHDRRC